MGITVLKAGKPSGYKRDSRSRLPGEHSSSATNSMNFLFYNGEIFIFDYFPNISSSLKKIFYLCPSENKNLKILH